MTTKFKNISDKNNFEFELTSPLSELSAADIDELTPWVGFHDKLTTRVDYGKLHDNTDNCGITLTSANYYDEYDTGFRGGSAKFNEVNSTDGIYLRCLLMYYNTDMTDSDMNFMSNKMNATNYPNVRFVRNITCGYNTTMQKLFYTDDNIGVPTNIDETIFQTELTETKYYIRPVWLVINDGNYYIFPTTKNNNDTYSAFMSGARYIDGQYHGYDNNGKVELFSNTDMLLFGTYVPLDSDMKRVHTYTTDSGGTIVYGYNYRSTQDTINNITLTDSVKFNILFSISYAGSAYSNITYFPLASSADLNKYYLSAFGFKFVYNGTTYRPIVKDGIVTGFTDDPTVKSEYDEWDDIEHNVPDGSGTNNSDKDIIDPMDSNDVYSLSGVVKYYLMNSATLAGMMNDIESITDDPNVMNGFVSCYQIPLQSDNMVVTGEGSNIIINGHALNTTANRVVAGKTINIASFGVPRRHNNAYDYMTKYFVYTPYTDVIPLNYKCAGNTILIQLHPCPENCTAVITVKCNNMIIYKTTVAIGTTSAINVENNAEKQLSIVNSCAKYSGSALSTSVGVATGNIPAVAAGAIGLIASTTHAMTAFTQSYNHSYGTNSGNMLSLMPSGIYLIEYVVKPDKPDNFARINGNIVNKSATIATGMGFTKLDKPRISTTLTALENTELIAMLENGVIL